MANRPDVAVKATTAVGRAQPRMLGNGTRHSPRHFRSSEHEKAIRFSSIDRLQMPRLSAPLPNHVSRVASALEDASA